MPFPPPWSVHHNEDAYWVEDAHGHRFGFCYYRSMRLSSGNPAYLSEDEARRLVSNFARLPELLALKREKPLPAP